MLDKRIRAFIVEYVASKTRTFGGDKESSWGNPIAEALKAKPAMFAAGVDVGEVVDLVIEAVQVANQQIDELHRAKNTLPKF